MSQSEYKMVLRVCDENINSRREHLEKMREWTGKAPRWIENEGDDILFSYRPLNPDGTRIRQHLPSNQPFFLDVESNEDGHRLFGIELVLVWTVDDPPPPVRIHPRDFDRAMQKMMSTLDCEQSEIAILFYGWFNGGDEPIEW